MKMKPARIPRSTPAPAMLSSGLPSLHGPLRKSPERFGPAATLPGLAWTNLPEFPPVSSGFHPAHALGGDPAAPAIAAQGALPALCTMALMR